MTSLMSAGCGFDAGKRASVENSSTSRRTVSTAPAMVWAQARMTSSDAGSEGVARSKMTLNAFRGKRNRRKWILDLMGHAARHFAPRRLFLSLQKIGEIFEHEHVSRTLALMAQGGHRDRDVQRRALQRHFHLAGGHAHAIGAAQQWLQILQHFRRKYVSQACTAQHLLSLRDSLRDGTCAAGPGWRA